MDLFYFLIKLAMIAPNTNTPIAVQTPFDNAIKVSMTTINHLYFLISILIIISRKINF